MRYQRTNEDYQRTRRTTDTVRTESDKCIPSEELFCKLREELGYEEPYQEDDPVEQDIKKQVMKATFAYNRHCRDHQLEHIKKKYEGETL